MKPILSLGLTIAAMILSGCSPKAVADEPRRVAAAVGKAPESLVAATVKEAASDKNNVPILGFTEANYFTRKVADETWHCYRFTVLRDVKNRFEYYTELDVNLQFVKRGNDWYRKIGDVKATERAKELKAKLVQVRQAISEGVAAKVGDQDQEGMAEVFDLFASEARRFGFSLEEIKNIDAAIFKKADSKVDVLSGAAQRSQGIDRAKDEANAKAIRGSIQCLEALQQRISEFERSL